ncbi:FIST C-terminal domain-containing protein [bacterium]|nr:FIST C-terminal domain-containing protein [bacterium]
MSLKCAVGKGKNPESALAGQAAAEECRQALGTVMPDLLILFVSVVYNQQEVLETVRRFYPGVPLIGCSTAGEIYTLGPDTKSVALVALSGLKAKLEIGGDIAANALAAGKIIGRKLAGKDCRAVLMLSDGLAGDGAAVVRGLQEEIGNNIPLIGGAAGDDNLFNITFEYLDGSIHSGTVVAASLKGGFHFGIGVRHGWEPIGMRVHVTKSESNRLLEINGLPAIRLYEEYFGEYTERLRTEPLGRLAVYYPLGQAVPDSGELLLRAPLTMENDGSIKFAAGVPEGAEVRLMIGSVEGALQAARIAAMEALSQMQGRLPRLVLIFNCVARHRLLGPRAGEEITLVRDIMGKDVPVAGFYTYGEIAAMEGIKTNPSCFHNETIVILALG